MFRDFGGPCENRNNGDAVARYDHLPNRWLIVMPIFSRIPVGPNEPSVGRSGEPVNTTADGSGVRWYEFRVGETAARSLRVHQHGTYAPDGFERWMASPAMDAKGNIGVGYSFGGTPNFAGQRLAARLAGRSVGLWTLRETTLVEGAASQTNTLRWEDYTQTAVDPSDDCTIWYVGDYLKQGATNYSSRIGAIRMPGCAEARR